MLMIRFHAFALGLILPGSVTAQIRLQRPVAGPFGLTFNSTLAAWVSQLTIDSAAPNLFSFECGPDCTYVLRNWVNLAPGSHLAGSLVPLHHPHGVPKTLSFVDGAVAVIGFPSLTRTSTKPVLLTLAVKTSTTTAVPSPMLGLSPSSNAAKWMPSDFTVNFFGKPSARAYGVSEFYLVLDPTAIEHIGEKALDPVLVWNPPPTALHLHLIQLPPSRSQLGNLVAIGQRPYQGSSDYQVVGRP